MSPQLTSDDLLALAREVTADEAAELEELDAGGAFTLRIVTGEERARRQKGEPEAHAEEPVITRKQHKAARESKAGPAALPWCVTAATGDEAREKLHARLLYAHGRQARAREWRIELDSANDRSSGRHARATLAYRPEPKKDATSREASPRTPGEARSPR